MPVTLRGFGSLRTPVLALLALLATAYLLHASSSRPSTLKPNAHARRARRDPPVQGCPTIVDTKKEKAAILLLARDGDLEALVPTLANFEETFNARYRYPYVFLNEDGFSAAFEQGVRAALPSHAVVEFGTIPQEHWSIPDWLDKAQVRKGFEKMKEDGIQYADRESYHHMCRYYSGLFALHPLLEKYNFYWRLEPGVRFYCDLQYDPFRFMAQNNKVYGWVITIVETPNTIPTLFDSVLQWRDNVTAANTAYSRFSEQTKLVDWEKQGELWDFFMSNTTRDRSGDYAQKEEYNMCHFWTNFEIGDLRFFRSKEYRALFDHLDRAGGFYTERWGDAPIRSLALGLLAGFDRVHYFEDISYQHDWFVHVPQTEGVGCNCKEPPWGEWVRPIDKDPWYSCLPRWNALDSPEH